MSFLRLCKRAGGIFSKIGVLPDAGRAVMALSAVWLDGATAGGLPGMKRVGLTLCKMQGHGRAVYHIGNGCQYGAG